MRKIIIGAGAVLLAATAVAIANAEGLSQSVRIEDLNGDGVISTAEIDSQTPTGLKTLVRQVMRGQDADRDGLVTVAEASNPVHETIMLPGAGKLTFTRPLASVDANHDGRFGADEQATARAQVPAALQPLWDRTMKTLDVDGDGALSAAEYAAAMKAE